MENATKNNSNNGKAMGVMVVVLSALLFISAYLFDHKIISAYGMVMATFAIVLGLILSIKWFWE